MLWRLSSDLKRFKASTLGKPVIMGRKTYESIGKPLPGRETIVVTRDVGFSVPGVLAAPDLAAAIALARDRAVAMGADEVVIAGGGEIYAQALVLADRMVITHVELAPEGDAFFPPIDRQVWREVSRERCEPGEKDDASFTIAVYERRRFPAGGVENGLEEA